MSHSTLNTSNRKNQNTQNKPNTVTLSAVPVYNKYSQENTGHKTRSLHEKTGRAVISNVIRLQSFVALIDVLLIDVLCGGDV